MSATFPSTTLVQNTSESTASRPSCARVRGVALGPVRVAIARRGTRLDAAIWHSVRKTGCWKLLLSKYLRLEGHSMLEPAGSLESQHQMQ